MTRTQRVLARVIRPLKSRKVRVALVTVIVAYAADAGFDLSEGMVMSVVGVGVALILGIAHEDNGAKRLELSGLELAHMPGNVTDAEAAVAKFNWPGQQPASGNVDPPESPLGKGGRGPELN